MVGTSRLDLKPVFARSRSPGATGSRWGASAWPRFPRQQAWPDLSILPTMSCRTPVMASKPWTGPAKQPTPQNAWTATPSLPQAPLPSVRASAQHLCREPPFGGADLHVWQTCTYEGQWCPFSRPTINASVFSYACKQLADASRVVGHQSFDGHRPCAATDAATMRRSPYLANLAFPLRDTDGSVLRSP